MAKVKTVKVIFKKKTLPCQSSQKGSKRPQVNHGKKKKKTATRNYFTVSMSNTRLMIYRLCSCCALTAETTPKNFSTPGLIPLENMTTLSIYRNRMENPASMPTPSVVPVYEMITKGHGFLAHVYPYSDFFLFLSLHMCANRR